MIWIRPRGLHIQQAGIFDGHTSASLFDVARIAFQVDPSELKHPLCFYIPKSESAEEALWWRDVFQAIAEARGWPRNYIKCMALVESHPLAFQMEEFLYNLRDHILGLNLGRWDYMASLIHFNLERSGLGAAGPQHDSARRAVFSEPARTDAGNLPQARHAGDWRNDGAVSQPGRCRAECARARCAGERQKERSRMRHGWRVDRASGPEPDCDGAVPGPNQLNARTPQSERYPDLRPSLNGVGKKTVAGTRAAIRTVIRYRNGVLNGKGASLLDGYMEDLATDRIYRLMIAQRMRHGGRGG